jgi:uncharacterized protein YbaR (Trm112 family)
MFIELVDALRCPRSHEESWLVLAASRIEARHIREGTLGCPVCRAAYEIHEGIADFRDGAGDVAAPLPDHALSSHAPFELPEADHLAAMMSLGDALGFAVLVGDWGRRAEELLDVVEAPPLLLVNPPADVAMRPGLSGVRFGAALPLAVGAARAVAVDSADEAHVESAARTTRVGGRVIAPAPARVPVGVRELARDATVWVGEREASPSALVTLHVRRG